MPENCTVQSGPGPPGPPWPGGQFTFAFCGMVTVWNSEALTPLPDSRAWPTKNAMNETMSETMSVSDVSTIALAA